METSKIYCRKCQKTKNGNYFYDATQLVLDSNGKMSVCRDCIMGMYDNMFQNEKTMSKTIYRLCRLLDVRYEESSIDMTEKKIEKIGGTKKNSAFGYYLANLKSVGVKNSGIDDVTFNDISPTIVTDPITEDEDEDEHLRRFWGINFNYDDYVFLEEEFDDWKKTHKCDTKAESSLLKELCYKELEIRKARVEGKSTASLVKEKQDLMKTASVDPAKTSVAGGGKSQDTFSSFIKIIEETEPADYYADKGLFRDFDNIDFYFRKYVVRPLKNFITQSRDFNVEADSSEDEEEDIEEEPISTEE
jgi:hypothetical protein